MNTSTNLVIDGTADDGSFQSDATRGPFIVLDVDTQMFVSPTFLAREDAETFRAGLLAKITKVSDDAQAILTDLQKERDEWDRVHGQLIAQVQWARANKQDKFADCLRQARDHADTHHQAACSMYDKVYAFVHAD